MIFILCKSTLINARSCSWEDFWRVGGGGGDVAEQKLWVCVLHNQISFRTTMHCTAGVCSMFYVDMLERL